MSRVSGLAERIRLLVLRGDAPAGSRLLEVPLAQAFDVPRSAIRQALRLLEGQGLLTADESGGMRVVAPTAEDVEEALAVRAALEGLCATAAAERGLAPGAQERLEALAAAAARRADVLADRAFHRALAACADNRAAFVALDRLWDRLVVADARPGPAADHAALVAAVAAGDAEAAGALASRHALTNA